MAESFGSRVWTSFLATLRRIWDFIKVLSPKVLGPFLVLIVVLVGVLLVSLGCKELQIGGLIGKLLGKKDPSDGSKTIDVANSIDPQRVDSEGKLIPIGEADSIGDTQAVVVPIKDPGLFSDPKKVVFTEPGNDKPTQVTLPDGVTNSDVDQVIVVRPSVVVVTVKDSSGIKASTVDDLLKKYGK
jgi:hypothetical protein